MFRLLLSFLGLLVLLAIPADGRHSAHRAANGRDRRCAGTERPTRRRGDRPALAAR